MVWSRELGGLAWIPSIQCRHASPHVAIQRSPTADHGGGDRYPAHPAAPAPTLSPTPASQVAEILPGVCRWSAFSSEHRVELTSHAVRAGDNLLIFDPIPVADGLVDLLTSGIRPSVVLTNRNHEREAWSWWDRAGVPIFAVSAWENGRLSVGRMDATSERFVGCRWMELPGGAPGETAFLFEGLSLVVFGDAIVNLPGRTLELLPAKYCEDSVRLADSLRELLRQWRFSHAVCAHGNPLLGGADAKLGTLLNA